MLGKRSVKSWVVQTIKGIGNVLGTAHVNRKGLLVDFRPGFGEPSCANTCLTVFPPAGQDNVTPILDLPIRGEGRFVTSTELGIKGKRAIILPVQYQDRLVGVVMPVRRGYVIRELPTK